MTTIATTLAGVEGRRAGMIATALAVIGLSMGSTLVKDVGAPGPVVAFWRLVIGALVWQIILRVQRKRISRAELVRVLPAGLLFGLDLVLFFTAIRLTRVANAEFIGALAPVFIVPIAALVFHEQLRWAATAFGAAALAGVALIILSSPASGSHKISGDLLAVAAMSSWIGYLLVCKRVRATIDTDVFMATVAAVASVVVAPFAIATGDIGSLSSRGWVLIVVLALLTGTIAHGLLAWAQRHVDVSVIAILSLAQPGMASMWAFIILDETVRGVQIVGMVLVVFALGAFTVASRPRFAVASTMRRSNRTSARADGPS